MKPYFHHLFDCLQGRGETAAAPRCSLSAVAGGLAVVYGLGTRLRRGIYVNELLLPKHLPARVVSVGNLAVGGTGKTPVTACLTRLFQDEGKKVAILSRGYGGQNSGVTCISDGQKIYQQPPQVGEEAYWLARNLPGAAVYTGASRYEAGKIAWEVFKPDLFLLDDGFQHFQLHRDLDLVLLDAAAPFGNGHLLPRGILREPKSALAAAQVLILTRFQEERDRQTLVALETAYPLKTVLTATIAPSAARLYPEGRAEAPKVLHGQPLLAFAGLARPEVFRRSLEGLAVQLKGFHAFPDHHPFSQVELTALAREAAAAGAAALITTGKDWARLGEQWDAPLPLWVLEVEAHIDQPERILEFL
ncbi:MAG: tetraacyldisaccharide 4'-kinase [Deltaproteobacteria bacterium]|nr:tetraacyldisaccharide 4'-kinase [Deltaproteobacteria bacterium]